MTETLVGIYLFSILSLILAGSFAFWKHNWMKFASPLLITLWFLMSTMLVHSYVDVSGEPINIMNTLYWIAVITTSLLLAIAGTILVIYIAYSVFSLTAGLGRRARKQELRAEELRRRELA